MEIPRASAKPGSLSAVGSDLPFSQPQIYCRFWPVFLARSDCESPSAKRLVRRLVAKHVILTLTM
jgi:hypothetical protein